MLFKINWINYHLIKLFNSKISKNLLDNNNFCVYSILKIFSIIYIKNSKTSKKTQSKDQNKNPNI